MGNYHLSLGSPGYLAILLVLPVLWWMSWQSMAALGAVRRVVALGLRSLVVLLIVAALAEVQVVRTSDQLTVIYLLDQSLSVPPERRQEMLDYVNEAARRHRQPDDRAGVIVFGREAAVEIPPWAGDVNLSTLESQLDPEKTNLAGAMRLAAACFPQDAAKRMVVVSDGNENIGDAIEESERMAAAGVGIDVVPVHYRLASDVIVDRIAIPGDVRSGQPFDVRVVLSNVTVASGDSSRPVPGRLVVTQSAEGATRVVADEHVELPPGKKVFEVREQLATPSLYTYEARFVADRPEEDARPQNSRALGFAQVRGAGRVLLIEDADHPNEYNALVARLEKDDLTVTVRSTHELFSSMAELQPFDAVVLAGAPREDFTDDQIAMLARNTQQLGAGLVMLGGPTGFGAGGWANTEVEAAMPVDFHIKNAKVSPSGALVLVIDSSGSMSGEKLEAAKAASVASVKTLSERDLVGVVTFDSAARWIVKMTEAKQKEAIARRISTLGIGGGTNMRPGIELAHRALRGAEAACKHMILLTDGQSEGSGYEQLAAKVRQDEITLSTVAVGPDADVNLLSRMAQRGGGQFYRVSNPKLLPRVFMKETRRVSRMLIHDRYAVQPQIEARHEIISGLPVALPMIGGFVMTTRKNNPLVEVPIATPQPSGVENGTILACWQYGLGRSVAFTTDAGARWAKAWIEQPDCAKIFLQMIRWAMRPGEQPGKFTVATEVGDREVRVVVNALDEQDAFLNFLPMTGTYLGPTLKEAAFTLEQVAPGRYVGTFPTPEPGAYFATIIHGMAGAPPLVEPINVPASTEFLDRTTNETILERLAETVPGNGEPGVLSNPGLGDQGLELLLATNNFRPEGLPPALHHGDVWPLLVLLASCLFLGDVFVRRVHVGFEWMGPVIERVFGWLRRDRGAEVVPLLDRLRSRKAEVAQKLDRIRETARFEIAPDAAERGDTAIDDLAAAPQASRASAPALDEPSTEAETYTDRLLRAKRKAQQGRPSDEL